MKYPVVSVQTKDGVDLHGLFFEPENRGEVIKIRIHGTAGNFYSNSCLEQLTHSSLGLGIAHLTTNNRGTGVYEIEKGTVPHGAALEKFEDCILDIDAWIEFARDRGYTKVILEGHSFGSEKTVYYLNKGTYADTVVAVILMGFSDNVGTQQRYEQKIGRDYVAEARSLVAHGKGDHLLSDIGGLAGEIPISASTYLNFFSPDSESSQALPLRQGKDLTLFRNIHVPILGLVGDNEDGEYTIIPIDAAVALLKSENSRAEVYKIQNCNHCFEGKEQEVSALVSDFIQRRVFI